MLTLEQFEGLTTRQQFKAVYRLARVVAKTYRGRYNVALTRFNGQAINVRGFGDYGASVPKILNGQCRAVGAFRNRYLPKLSVVRLGYKLSKGETFLGYGASTHFNKYDLR